MALDFLESRDADGDGSASDDAPAPFLRDASAAARSSDAIMAGIRSAGPLTTFLPRPDRRGPGLVGLAAAAALLIALSSLVTFGVMRSGATVEVRFVLVAPDARSVWLAADFNQWSPDGYEMHRTSDGPWEITVPLRKDKSYSYNFIIDGERWIADPGAPSRVDDGFGGASSSLSL
jgi:hypothetical protein